MAFVCFSFTFLLLGEGTGDYFHWFISSQQSFPASGFARRPAYPSDKALSPEEQLPRVHAPCLVSARGWGGWRKQVPVGAPLHPPRNARSPLCSPSALAEQFEKISSFEQKEFISAIANVVVSHGSRADISWEMCISRFPSADKTLDRTPTPTPAAARTGPGGAAAGREGKHRSVSSVSCRCPLVETGKISEKICWCWAGSSG